MKKLKDKKIWESFTPKMFFDDDEVRNLVISVIEKNKIC
jgi:hypothetical protein